MYDAEPRPYVFEEITPERMRRVNLLAEEGSDSEGAALPNNKDRVYRYRCPECSGVTAVLVRDVGHVRYTVDCADPACAGEVVQEDGAPTPADEHLLSHHGPHGERVGEQRFPRDDVPLTRRPTGLILGRR